jgi:putative membrane protein
MPDFATTDLAFAIGHHLLIFALAAVLAFEIGAIKQGMTGADVHRVGRVDIWYGILAALILIVGFGRVNFAAKGWAYYAHNHFFWAKMAAFAMVGILSIWPTLAVIRWRRMAAADPGFAPAAGQIRIVRRFLWTEVFFFALIPVFAAAMARGYGSP